MNPSELQKMNPPELHKNCVFRIVAPIFFIVLLGSMYLGIPILMFVQKVSPESVYITENILLWITVCGMLILAATLIFIMSRKRYEIEDEYLVCRRFNTVVSREKLK